MSFVREAHLFTRAHVAAACPMGGETRYRLLRTSSHTNVLHCTILPPLRDTSVVLIINNTKRSIPVWYGVRTVRTEYNGVCHIHVVVPLFTVFSLMLRVCRAGLRDKLRS